jgi:hypothetical protein
MAHPAYIQKTLFMKPEVSKIFDELELFHDFCRLELLPFDPANLYNRESKIWNHYYSVTYGRKSRARRKESVN